VPSTSIGNGREKAVTPSRLVDPRISSGCMTGYREHCHVFASRRQRRPHAKNPDSRLFETSKDAVIINIVGKTAEVHIGN
jgi:hypothetical protein